jgi:hypothetical protein
MEVPGCACAAGQSIVNTTHHKSADKLTGILFIEVSASTAARAPTAHAASSHTDDQALESHILQPGNKVQTPNIEIEYKKRRSQTMHGTTTVHAHFIT